MRVHAARWWLAATTLTAFASTARAQDMEIAVADGKFHDAILEKPVDPERDLIYQRAKELGATWIRTTLYWTRPSNGVYDDSYPLFPRFDAFVKEAQAKGFQVQITLSGAGIVAPFTSGQPMGIDPDPAEFARFVGACVRHYRPLGVVRFSMWNEPNLPYFLVAADPQLLAQYHAAPQKRAFFNANILPRNIQRYRQLYIAGHDAAKLAAPDAQVWFGEISSTHDPLGFIDQVARGGRTLKADGFAFHPYQFVVEPGQPGGAGISRLAALQSLIAQMAREGRLTTQGGGPVPLYLTEFGYLKQEDRLSNPTVKPAWWSNTQPDAVRAKWLPEAFEEARKVGAKQMLEFQLWPPVLDSSWDTSILDRAGNPMASFQALQAWIAGPKKATLPPPRVKPKAPSKKPAPKKKKATKPTTKKTAKPDPVEAAAKKVEAAKKAEAAAKKTAVEAKKIETAAEKIVVEAKKLDAAAQKKETAAKKAAAAAEKKEAAAKKTIAKANQTEATAKKMETAAKKLEATGAIGSAEEKKIVAEAKKVDAAAEKKETAAKKTVAAANETEAAAKKTIAKANQTEAGAKKTEAQANKIEASANEMVQAAKKAEAAAKAKEEAAKKAEAEAKKAEAEAEARKKAETAKKPAPKLTTGKRPI